MRGLMSIVCFCACAPRVAASGPSSAPSRPHAVALQAQAIGCAKTQTAVTLGAGWTAVSSETPAHVLRRDAACRTILVVRAGRRADAGLDFAASWALAERAAEGVTWFAESPVEPRAI